MSRGYYSVVPASVRYDNHISERAKLIYAEITALLNDNGFCEDTNGYFAALFKVHKNTISRSISMLAKRGHIQVQYVENNTLRRIWIK
jgi:hypothetical protein